MYSGQLEQKSIVSCEICLMKEKWIFKEQCNYSPPEVNYFIKEAFMDILGSYIPIDFWGYKYILVIEQIFSRHCMFSPHRTISTKIVADAFMNKYIANLAISNYILSDLDLDNLHIIYQNNFTPRTPTAQIILRELLEFLGKCLEL